MSVTANLTTNVETITATIVVEDETIIAEINTAARGPAGPAGGGTGSIDSATTSDGTANLDLLNVDTVTATVTGTLTADHIHGNLAGNVYGHIRAGETLEKGDPVYVSGSHGSGSTLIPIVSKADASNAAKMPAIGIMDAGVTIHNNGHMVIVGTITELDTTGLTVNAELYVKAGGGLTGTPPTARAQPVARVERVNANNGAVIVKVNGLSASDATASTLVRRDSNGDASFGALNTSGLTVTGGTTFGEESLVQFDAIEYYYGTGAASAHRIALGAGTTGSELFGAATAAAARTTLMGEILKYDPNAAATRTNPANQTDDDVLTGIDLTAGIWEISFYSAFDTGACGVIQQISFGTPASVDAPSSSNSGYYVRGTQGPAGIIYNATSGVGSLGSSGGSLTNWIISGYAIYKITGATTLSLRYARNSDSALATIIRRAGAFLRARKINQLP